KRQEAPAAVFVKLSDELLKRFLEGYEKDPQFSRVMEWTKSTQWSSDYRFFRNEDGLLFFKDADYSPRLCVPKNIRPEILIQAHEHPMETAH
ncbi:hypothetical protein CYLTODRAFT_321467, partial [Cylindrobasidium torrendii FP15055 ss-10]